MEICYVDSPERIAHRMDVMSDFCTSEIADEFLFRCNESNGIEFVPFEMLQDMQTLIRAELARRIKYGDENV